LDDAADEKFSVLFSRKIPLPGSLHRLIDPLIGPYMARNTTQIKRSQSL
jgi:hypothetical protein